MKLRLFFLLFMVMSARTVAQNYALADYRHTINYMDHKVSFQLQEVGIEVKSIDPFRAYHWYAANQVKVTQGGYSGRLLHGDYMDYYIDNNLREKGRFDMGLKSGEWKSWTAKGVLSMTLNYKKGQLSGQYVKYDTLGRQIEKGSYKNGLINGKVIKLDNGDSIQVVYYKKGILQQPKPKKSWGRRMKFWRK